MNTALNIDPFQSVPPHNYLGFYDDKHYYPKKVADWLDYSPRDVSKIAQVPVARVRWDKQMPKEISDRMREIGNICEIVAGYFGGDVQKTATWFQVPNPMFGNLSPKDMIRYGRYKKVLQLIQSAIAGDVP